MTIEIDLKELRSRIDSTKADNERWLARHPEATVGMFDCLLSLEELDALTARLERAEAEKAELQVALSRYQSGAAAAPPCNTAPAPPPQSDTSSEKDDDEIVRACVCRKCLAASGETVEMFAGVRVPIASTIMVLCQVCGNKRCPHANDCSFACTGSNEPGQPGSAYPRVTLP